MAEATLPEIRRFLNTKRLAMAGVSRNEKHFSRALYRTLRDRGYDVVPVNPQAEMIGDDRCYPRVSSIEPPVEAVLVMTPAQQTATVCEDCMNAGVARVWMYRAAGHGAVDPEAAERCRTAGAEVIEGHCPFMFLEDSEWFHRLHGGLLKLFGKFPVDNETRPS